MEKENLKNVSSNEKEKKPKTYKELAIVLGLTLAFMLMSQCMGCYSCSSDRWNENGVERRVISAVDETLADALMEREEIDRMKVDEIRKQGLDSIGLYRKGKKWGFYNLDTEKLLGRSPEGTPKEYDKAGFFAEGLAAVQQKSMIGFIDLKGKQVIPFQFLARTNDEIKAIAFQNGYCKMARRDGRLHVNVEGTTEL